MLWKQLSYLRFLLVPTTGARILQDVDEERVRVDLVRLIPFDVQIAMAGPTDGVNIYALRDIVTDWMHESFERKSQSQGLLSDMITFDSILLDIVQWTNGNLELQEDIGLYTASFEGVSLWNRKGLATPPTDPESVILIQRATNLEKNGLLTMLQNAQDFSVLGSNLIDVRALIVVENTPSSEEPSAAPIMDDTTSLPSETPYECPGICFEGEVLKNGVDVVDIPDIGPGTCVAFDERFQEVQDEEVCVSNSQAAVNAGCRCGTPIHCKGICLKDGEELLNPNQVAEIPGLEPALCSVYDEHFKNEMDPITCAYLNANSEATIVAGGCECGTPGDSGDDSSSSAVTGVVAGSLWCVLISFAFWF